MRFYLDEAFRPEYLELAASLRSEEYYVNMMTAWYFATALAKQYGAALPYLQERRLDPWTHNKTIQKALESRRISEEQKNLSARPEDQMKTLTEDLLHDIVSERHGSRSFFYA